MPGQSTAVPRQPPEDRRASRGVLVTGSHRSGTTWVGKIIASAPRTAYLHEPFKLYPPRWRPAYLWTQFDDWFLYVDDFNAHAHEPAIARTLALRYDWRQYYGYHPGPGVAWRATRNWVAWTAKRLRGFRPVMKDPLALFSAEWLARRFGLDVVVMIRHPAAFASSIKVKRWRFDFNHWLRQERLMAGPLAPFAVEIERCAAAGDCLDLIEQAVLQWRAFHHVIHGYRQRNPGWHFVRHEDLSADPVAGFRDLYGHLGFPFTPRAERAVRSSSDSANPPDSSRVGDGGDEYKLDSGTNVWSWRLRLSADEIRRVRDGTAEVAQHFYGDSRDWGD